MLSRQGPAWPLPSACAVRRLFPSHGELDSIRVREPRDVNLVLGQGMLRAGWDAQNLYAPGKFLVSAPGHDKPERARAYLLTDQVVTDTSARYANSRPGLDTESRRAILAANDLRDSAAGNPAADIRVAEVSHSADDVPGQAGRGRGAVARAVPRAGRGNRRQRAATADRDEPPDPVPPSGRTRQSRPRRPGQPGPLACGHHRGAATVSDRLTVRLISRLARASARKRAYTPAETNAETNTQRHTGTR